MVSFRNSDYNNYKFIYICNRRTKFIVTTTNKNRSSKNKRVWNYVKSIQRNYYPNKSLKEIRSLLKKHRQGLETDIPDVAWRNPSP